jgi:hypothetical protein
MKLNKNKVYSQSHSYTECQTFYLVIGIGSPHPLTRQKLLPPPRVQRGDTIANGGRGTQCRRWDRPSGTLDILLSFDGSTVPEDYIVLGLDATDSISLFKTDVMCQWDLLNIFKQKKAFESEHNLAIGNKLVATVSLIPVINYLPGPLKKMAHSNKLVDNVL